MDGDIRFSIDKLPIKRLASIEENGVERFAPEVGPEENRVALIRRIDFTPLVEKDAKKAKESSAAAAAPWPWLGLVENLKLAQEELSVIMDVVNTVEANDAVTVAGMSRPKQLPNETLSDIAVSAATKLQRFKSISKYFKQSKKALENQIARESRFYSALIRLQHNWKVKYHRMAAIPGSESFTFDLSDSLVSDPAAMIFSPMSVVRVDRHSSGMLSICLPTKSYRFLQFGFLGDSNSEKLKGSSKSGWKGFKSEEAKREIINSDDVNKSVKDAHSILRGIRQAVFDEQVFGLVSKEAFQSSLGVNVNSIKDDYLQLGIGQEASIYLSLGPYSQEVDSDIQKGLNPNAENLPLVKYNESVKHPGKKFNLFENFNPLCCEIYLRQILHENVLRGKEKRFSSVRSQQAQSSAGEGNNVLVHFCMTLAHRLFSKKVLIGLENLVSGVSYLHMSTHPTWHSRTSSWSLLMRVPHSVINAKNLIRPSDSTPDKNVSVRSQFYTKIVVRDESISVSGEGAPNVVGLFRGGDQVNLGLVNTYDCNLEDLPMMLLQQVASQVVLWLHEEALIVGMKATRDFLALSFELDQGDTLSLVAHVDPDDDQGCISWWMLMENASIEESRYSSDYSKGDGSDDRKILGYLSLESLYALLMDLVSVCSSSGSN